VSPAAVAALAFVFAQARPVSATFASQTASQSLEYKVSSK